MTDAVQTSQVPPNTVCSLELTNIQAVCLFNVLSRAQNIKGSKQTHRSRVLNALSTQLREFEDARMSLIKLYCKKTENGEPARIKHKDTGVEAYDMEDQNAFNHAFRDLQREQTIVLDGSSNTLLNRALGIVYDILNSDDCPQLAPPRNGVPMEESEVLLFGQVVDAFTFTLVK